MSTRSMGGVPLMRPQGMVPCELFYSAQWCGKEEQQKYVRIKAYISNTGRDISASHEHILNVCCFAFVLQ